MLCDLEAYTCEEAARRMGCPVGTVKSWRFRGRQRLRRPADSPRPGSLGGARGDDRRGRRECRGAGGNLASATRALSQWMTAGEVSASVQMLVKGVLKTMIIGKLRTTAVACMHWCF